jgi:hypothetical protein
VRLVDQFIHQLAGMRRHTQMFEIQSACLLVEQAQYDPLTVA